MKLSHFCIFPRLFGAPSSRDQDVIIYYASSIHSYVIRLSHLTQPMTVNAIHADDNQTIKPVACAAELQICPFISHDPLVVVRPDTRIAKSTALKPKVSTPSFHYFLFLAERSPRYLINEITLRNPLLKACLFIFDIREFLRWHNARDYQYPSSNYFYPLWRATGAPLQLLFTLPA